MVYFSRPLTIIIFGPAGSGKGTQVKLLQQEIDLVKVEAGEIVRQRLQQGDTFARQIAKITSQGKRLSDEQITGLIKDYLKGISPQESIIFDGYPRSIGQAKMFIDLLKELKRDDLIALWLIVSDKEVMRRLLNRSVCQLGHVFLTQEIKICPYDQTEARARYDDTEEAIKNRLAWYHNEILPTIEYFRDKSQFFEINGEQSIEAVHQEIMERLKTIN